MDKPKALKDEHLRFLDTLRESGQTSMLGFGRYLQDVYPELTKHEAKEILLYWMETFGERHNENS